MFNRRPTPSPNLPIPLFGDSHLYISSPNADTTLHQDPDPARFKSPGAPTETGLRTTEVI